MKAIKINKLNKKMVCISFIFVILLTSTIFSGCLRNIGLGGEDYRWDVEWITEPGNYGSGDYGREIEFDGLTRFYKFHVPISYEPDEAIPVVLCFHGGGGYPGAVRYQTDFDEIADEKGFIIVYPAGTGTKKYDDRLLIWNDGRPFKNGTHSKIDDVGYVEKMLDDLESLFNVDVNRVYSCGFSNGAQFTNVLAQKLSDRIAAIATNAGHRSIDAFFPPPPRPVAKMQFSGLKDKYAPYYGGSPPSWVTIETHLLPVRETIESWVDFNGCPCEPSETFRIGNAVCERYGPGLNDTEVVFWTLEDGGHTWPGGKMTVSEKFIGLGHINEDISASDLIWEFFEQHPMK